tara:strand:+ start:318 stop:506 length:189 start_codon:yes stop_codon:yes gene_type:complete
MSVALSATFSPSSCFFRVRSVEFSRDIHKFTVQGIRFALRVALPIVGIAQLAPLYLFALFAA